VVALIGLIASFHTILYAQGRQIYSLSRAGYFPTALSVTHAKYKTPHIAMITGSILGLAVVLIVWFSSGGASSDWVTVSAIVLNMAVFGAMLSYIAQAVSFILLRRNQPNIERPFRSPVGIPGAVVTIIIALVTLYYQLLDPNFVRIVPWVIAWLVIGAIYFAVIGRNKLILSPEEEFALEHNKK
jgi:ethanolamine permease